MTICFCILQSTCIANCFFNQGGGCKILYEIAAVGRVSDESRVPGGIIYSKFSEKPTFLPPDTHTYTHVRIREKQLLVFRKILCVYTKCIILNSSWQACKNDLFKVCNEPRKCSCL